MFYMNFVQIAELNLLPGQQIDKVSWNIQNNYMKGFYFPGTKGG